MLAETKKTTRKISIQATNLAFDILLILILFAGLLMRITGISWGDNYHLHPDERFMAWVTSDLAPVKGVGEFFNTEQSTLNPNNRGHGFYVYGTLPIFVVRGIGDQLGQVGFGEIELVGRYVSAIFDLFTVFLVYLIAIRLYKKEWIGVLASGFAAFSVLPIQQAHFFTVDSFANFFITLTFYFGAFIFSKEPPKEDAELNPLDIIENEELQKSDSRWAWLVKKDWKGFIPYAAFGIAYGMALSSKISAFPIAILLPISAYIYYRKLKNNHTQNPADLIIRNVVLAGVLAVLVFRICQPYAFAGPGFFNIGLNPKWVNNMTELSGQSGGDVDFPPALQWARRPITFSLQNMVVWGLGLPFGLLACTGFLWMGYKLFKGESNKHFLIWFFTGSFFTWQSINFTRSMRYQLPIYPTLAVIAAWFVGYMWYSGKSKGKWLQYIAAAVGIAAIVGTGSWAYAFTRIYTRPVTRIAASEWIFKNVPAAINLPIKSLNNITNQPVSFRLGETISVDKPITLAFTPNQAGDLTEINFAYVLDPQLAVTQKTMVVTLSENKTDAEILATGIAMGDFSNTAGDPRGDSLKVEFIPPVNLNNNIQYKLQIFPAEKDVSLAINGPITYGLRIGENNILQPLPEAVEPLEIGKPFLTSFNALQDGTINEIYFYRLGDRAGNSDDKVIKVMLAVSSDQPTSTAFINGKLDQRSDYRGNEVRVKFDQPLSVTKGQTYVLQIELLSGEGQIGIYGSKQAFESSWDDPLPLSMYGIDPYGYSTGVYRTDLNFEMYWDDSPEKLSRFETIMDQTDYIYFSSDRQWGTTVRVPERYPLTTEFYRNLLGCPVDQDIVNCYRVAEVGTYQGKLGFELVQVFQSDPNLGTLRFNTQFAEEAFSVYDHPKVMLFKKTNAYRSENVQEILGAVGLSNVVHLTPKQASSYKGNLTLPQSALAIQQAGGTWSKLFNSSALYNQYPLLGAVFFYLFISLLGWINLPLARFALRGLQDFGFPLVRLLGMLLLGYLVWLASSIGLQFERGTILAVLGIILLINLLIGIKLKTEIRDDIKKRWKYYLTVEVLILVFFVIWLLVRLGNSDLWHPAFGGEKPMDFSYFNAILKSSTFPPYDPWFAGGYINYYYFGFVIAAVPVKLLGIVPSIAYNLILPVLYAGLAGAVFCVVWNVLSGTGTFKAAGDKKFITGPVIGGVIGVIAVQVMGNLGTVKMIWQGLMKLGAPNGSIEFATVFEKISWLFRGVAQYFSGMTLPYSTGDWYWIPTRLMAYGEINEFPFFTFLYADLHAHLIALPFTVVAIAWTLSILNDRLDMKGIARKDYWFSLGAVFFIGAMVIGALRPMNTWDLPTYLVIGLLVILYSLVRNRNGIFAQITHSVNCHRYYAYVAGMLGILAALSFILYLPYMQWYSQGYNTFDLWKGPYTPVGAYLSHWGLFLFVIVTWLVYETIDWMAKTPVSALGKLKPYKTTFAIAGALLLIGMIIMLIQGVVISFIAVVLGLWVVALILRPDQSDLKRGILFLVGSAIALTLGVEFFTLRGDIGRMNTVFKFYLQAWVLLALSASIAMVWIWKKIQDNGSAWRYVWNAAFAMLVFSAALYPITATSSKIRDRMSPQSPRTLDGMSYMKTAGYSDNGKDMDLGQDYDAIRWVQENIKGSPVILEANTVEYRWGSRFTIYTGLPGVVGWNWHQRQQRSVLNVDVVQPRVDEITKIYNSMDRTEVTNFLKKYNVRYIIVGQLEQANYSPEGLTKFQLWQGTLWNEVYQSKDTHIYEVITNAQ